MLLCVCVESGSVSVLSLVWSLSLVMVCFVISDYVIIFVRTGLDWFD